MNSQRNIASSPSYNYRQQTKNITYDQQELWKDLWLFLNRFGSVVVILENIKSYWIRTIIIHAGCITEVNTWIVVRSVGEWIDNRMMVCCVGWLKGNEKECSESILRLFLPFRACVRCPTFVFFFFVIVVCSSLSVRVAHVLQPRCPDQGFRIRCVLPVPAVRPQPLNHATTGHSKNVPIDGSKIRARILPDSLTLQ